MKLGRIKTGFYTDGEKLFSYVGGRVCVWCACDRTEGFAAGHLFQQLGNHPARIRVEDADTEVRPVKAGEVFYDGEIVIEEKKVAIVTEISLKNPIYKGEYLISYDGYSDNKKRIRFDGCHV